MRGVAVLEVADSNLMHVRVDPHDLHGYVVSSQNIG